MKKVKIGVLNAIPTTEENGVFHDDAQGIFGVVVSGEEAAAKVGTAPLVIGPIEYGADIRVDQIPYAAEAVLVVNLTDGESIVAGRRYGIKVESNTERVGDWPTKENYTYVAESGDTLADVYAILKNKINNNANSRVTCEFVSEAAFTLGKGTGTAVGDIVTQETSGATALVVEVSIATGSFAGGDAAGTIYLRLLSGVWDATAKTLEVTTGNGVTTGVALADDLDNIITIDKGDYWMPTVNGRGGSSVVAIYGFTTVSPTVIQDAVYSAGYGPHLVLTNPVMNIYGTDVVSGDLFHATETPLLGTINYHQVILTVVKKANRGNLSDSISNIPMIYHLFIINSNDTKRDAIIAEIVKCAALAYGATYA